MAALEPAVRFVIFDMDDVLYDYDHAFRLRELAQLTGRSEADIDRDVWGGGHEERAEAGDPATADAYLAQFGELLGYPIDAESWMNIRRRMATPRPAVLQMVRELKSRVDVALLTNNGMMLKRALPVCAPETIEIFGAKAHVSAEFGWRKPDPKVYRAICSHYGYAPAQTAFVDDKAENIEGAQAAGLIGHHYKSADGLREFLTRLAS